MSLQTVKLYGQKDYRCLAKKLAYLRLPLSVV